MSAKTTTSPETGEATDVELVKYEMMAIITPDVSQSQYEKHVDELKKLITKAGGSIWHEEDWGKRELAYTIKKQDFGYYIILNFEVAPSAIPEMNDQLRLMQFVLRNLIIKPPEGYTPQEYDLDEEEEVKLEPKKVERKAPKAAAPAPVKEVPVEEEAEEAEPEAEEEEPEVEEEKPEPEEEKPKVEEKEEKKEEVISSDKESSERLSKLDAKLEELLSGDDDLNL